MARKKIAKKKSIAKVKSTARKPIKKAAKPVKAKINNKAKTTRKVKKRKVLPIPKGYHSITPYLIADEAAKAIAFYKSVFGAKQMFRMDKPDGKVGHAELKIGDAKIMVADKCPEMEQMSNGDYGSGAISIHLYTKNADVVIKKAVSAGAKILMPIQDMFYGDRSGMIKDPFGHMWCVSTHIEDVTPAKMKKRAVEIYGGSNN